MGVSKAKHRARMRRQRRGVNSHGVGPLDRDDLLHGYCIGCGSYAKIEGYGLCSGCFCGKKQKKKSKEKKTREVMSLNHLEIYREF